VGLVNKNVETLGKGEASSQAGRRSRAENCVSHSWRAPRSRYPESFYFLLVQVNSQTRSVWDLQIAVLGA